MMRIILAAAILALSLSIHAQTAKVIQLTPAEANEAKSLHDQQKAIEQKLKDLEHRIQTNHLLDKNNSSPEGSNPSWHQWLPGWSNGNFQYSEDFLFIVPQGIGYTPTFGVWNAGCSTFTTQANCCNLNGIQSLPYGTTSYSGPILGTPSVSW